VRVYAIILVLVAAMCCSLKTSANDKNSLFPNSLKLPLIGPSEPAKVCLLPSRRSELENELNAKVEVDCVRLSVSAVETYDDENDVFLLLAYANILHGRGWETTDMVSGTPLIRAPNPNDSCKQHLMITGGWLSEYFPDEGFTDDEGQYIFLSFFMDEDGNICGKSVRDSDKNNDSTY